MAASMLLNQVSNEFGGDTLNRIATAIGESPGKIKTALSDMLPALLGGIAAKAQTHEGANELLDVVHRDHLDSERYEHVSDAIQEPNALGNLMNTGTPLLDTVLPGNSGAVSNWVASHAGINPATSKTLMAMALPLVLGLISRRVGNAGESGLRSLLGKPQTFLQEAPGPLSGLLGMGTTAAGAARTAASGIGERGEPYAAEAMRPASRRKWLVPLLVVLGLIALLLYMMNRPVQTPTAPTSTAPATTAPGAAGSALGAMTERQLPNGTTLRIPANGVESRLLAFIPQQNLQLSQARANTTMNQVAALGVDPTRLAAEGYGDQHPVADNASEEGRQRNRRVDINVTAK